MKKLIIDWRENLQFLFLPKSDSDENVPIRPGPVRWMILSKILPNSFYHFFNSGIKTPIEPLEAFKIADKGACPLIKLPPEEADRECEYYKTKKRWPQNTEAKCRRCCVCAQYKLLYPSNAMKNDILNDHTYEIKATDYSNLHVVTDKRKKSDNPLDTDYLVIEKAAGSQVNVLFESEFERKNSDLKTSERADEIKNWGFYTRVCQFIEDSIDISYEDPKLYKIDLNFLEQVQKNLLGQSDQDLVATYKDHIDDKETREYTFNFMEFRAYLSGRGKNTVPTADYKGLLNNCFKLRKGKKRRVFFKNDFKAYLNQADKAIKEHYEHEIDKDVISEDKDNKENSTENDVFEKRFVFLICMAICQFFLNHDYFKDYFINCGSAAQDDEDIYEKK